jgi:hypothetical protein
MVGGQPRQIVHETHLKNTQHEKGLVPVSLASVKPQYHQQNKEKPKKSRL